MIMLLKRNSLIFFKSQKCFLKFLDGRFVSSEFIFVFRIVFHYTGFMHRSCICRYRGFHGHRYLLCSYARKLWPAASLEIPPTLCADGKTVKATAIALFHLSLVWMTRSESKIWQATLTSGYMPVLGTTWRAWGRKKATI